MRTRRWVQAALLLVMGLYLLDNIVTGKILYYVNDRFVWLSWLAMAILVIVGTINVIELLREPRETAELQTEHDHEHHDHDHDEHDHGHEHDHAHGHAASWPIIGVVAVPLILGLLIPAKPLGADALGTNGISTTSFSESQNGTTQLSVAPTDLNVLDWVRAFNSADNVQQFEGQSADVIGFVYRDPSLKSSQMMVARFMISCCVADASAIGVIVQSADSAKYVQDSWVHIKGQFQVQDFNGQKTPILVASLVENTTQPQHPYLYP